MIANSVRPPSEFANDKTSEDLFLDWFALKFSTPIIIERPQFGDLSYFRSFALHKSDTQSFVSAGRGSTAQLAAVKCAAEYLERRTYLDFQKQMRPETGICGLDRQGRLSLTDGPSVSSTFPKKFQTSNGWAVHFSKEKALENAHLELLERHCLMLSYLSAGFRGFSIINDLSVGDCRLLSLLTGARIGGFQAAMVVGVVPATGGVSFGYMCDLENKVQSSPKWAHAFFESFDQIDTFKIDRQPQPESIESDVQHYLTTPFSQFMELEKDAAYQAHHALSPSSFQIFDLQKELRAPMPIYAAHVWNDDLIPLFQPHKLGATDLEWFHEQFANYGDFADLPKRTPVL